MALPNHPYPVIIGSGVRFRFSDSFEAYGKGNALWITDRNVADAWGSDLGNLCKKSLADLIILPPGEEGKNLATVEKLCSISAQMGLERGDTLVACGGGVVGDVVGFAAACYKRGIAYVQMPTTLLAMVDASVGGKTGVDLPEGKNMVGAFHQPAFVLADVDFLKTLDPREFRSGFAEVVKTALVGNAHLFDELSRDAQRRLFNKDILTLVDAIETCVRFKAEVVCRDEKELDHRRILNFGHTVGHALEALGNYAKLKHGEALFWGMWAAVELSLSQGLLNPQKGEAIFQLLAPHLKTIPSLKFKNDEILAFLGRDKKVQKGIPNFVLLEDVGKAILTDAVNSKQLEDVLDKLKELMRRMKETS